MPAEIKVKDIMDGTVKAILLNSVLGDAAGAVDPECGDDIPVVDDNGCLLGILPVGDIIKALAGGKKADIKDLLSKDFVCITESEDVKTILDSGREKLYVVDNDSRFIGTIKKSDILKMYYGRMQYSINSYHAMLESTSNGIIAIDCEQNVVVFNKAAEDMLGVSESYALHKKIADVLPQSVLPYVLETGCSDDNTIHINGKTLVASRTPILQGENIIGAVSIFRDITDYKNVLEQLDEERNAVYLLKTIMETIYDCIVYVDKDGYIKMISKAYTKFLGVNENDVIGKHVTEVIENTRMHIVVKTGKAEIADIQKIKGNQMIATRIPVVMNGSVVGAVGKVLFKNIEELNSLYNKVRGIERELELYKDEFKRINRAKYSMEGIIGNSKAMKEIRCFAEKAAQVSSNVLLLGESGTGKELFAHAIHNASRRSQGPFVKVNCAAIPYELLESELFGYEGGAFTGARREGKIGKFKVADGGTIFLDEIGDLPLSMQVKLLRALQDKEIEKIGSNVTEKIDVRIIAATNKNLEHMVKDGQFRMDLFYRLNVLTINIPPLRERGDDVIEIANYLVKKISDKAGVYVERISDKAMECLKKYDWPGNIRELENLLERAVSILDGDTVIRPEHLPSRVAGIIEDSKINNLEDILNKAERQAIIDSLIISRGSKTKAANLLNISRSSLYEKMSKHNIAEYLMD